MRLSALVIAAILSLSTTFMASSAGGGASSSGGGHSGGGGGYSGGVSSGASSHASSGISHSSVGTSSRASSSKAGSTSATSSKITGKLTGSSTSKTEKRGFFSFLHHKQPAPVLRTNFTFPIHCRKGQNCQTSCQSGVWNSATCANQYALYQYLSPGCQTLGSQLASQRELMRDQSDAGESLRYRLLLDQYQQCLNRYNLEPFGSYGYDEAWLFDIP